MMDIHNIFRVMVVVCFFYVFGVIRSSAWCCKLNLASINFFFLHCLFRTKCNATLYFRASIIFFVGVFLRIFRKRGNTKPIRLKLVKVLLIQLSSDFEIVDFFYLMDKWEPSAWNSQIKVNSMFYFLTYWHFYLFWSQDISQCTAK